MSFLGLPAGSALLLLAGVAAVVVLLYLLKPLPRRLVVASSLIWQRVLKERKRKPERLRWWLSLLLALAIALSVAVALTRPEVAALSGTAADVVLVIDNAPTMAARTVDGRTRLQHALDRAEQVVAAAGAGSRYLVADTMRVINVPMFEARDAALARLRAIEPSTAGTPWFPDVVAAAGTSERRQLWYVTDGVTPVIVPQSARTISVFQVADNAGITAFDVRALPSDARRHEAFIEVTNGSPGNKAVALRLAGIGAPALTRELQLAGGATANVVLDVSAFAEGPLRAAIRADGDALGIDDVAYAYLPGKGRVRVGLVTRGNQDLARALRLLPRLDVEVVASARLREARGFDALVIDRVAVPEPPPAPSLIIGSSNVPWLARRAGELTDTRLAQWDDAHPLLSGVSMRDVLIDRAVILKQAELPGAPALMTVARGPSGEPLMLATREGRRFALVGFDLEASSFPEQAGYPAFLSNAIDWLTRQPRALSWRIGQVSVPLGQARVLDLDGRELLTRPAPPAATLFDAREPGLYVALAGDDRVRIAVNLLDPRITRINGGRFAQAGAGRAPIQSHSLLATDPWILLLALAVVLLGLEWWTFHRRVTV